MKCGWYVLGTTLHYIQALQQSALSRLVCIVSLYWHTPTLERTTPTAVMFLLQIDVRQALFIDLLILRKFPLSLGQTLALVLA